MKALNQAADERLLIEAAKRDPARFAELYSRNFHVVYAQVGSARFLGEDQWGCRSSTSAVEGST